MTAAPRVPVTVITGFLGAGKTTAIRHLLETVRAKRLALVINEFGDVGVDGDILRACGVDSCPEDAIVELSNGCLCCTVADDFVPAIEALLSREPRPEHIVVETSGLALPKPLIKALDWPAIRARVTVDGVVAVVDGAAVADGRFADDPERLLAQRRDDPAADHENPLEEVYEDQLLCADLVVVNKADLLAPAALETVRAAIAATVPRAVKIVAAVEGRVEPAVLLGIGAAAEDDLDTRPSHHDAEGGHDHDDFETFVVEVPAITDPAAFTERLGSLAERHGVLRTKGFLAVEGRPMRLLVQGVGRRFRRDFERPWRPDEPRRGRLVVIGEKGLDRGAIEAELAG